MILDAAKAYVSANLIWVKLAAIAIVIAFLAYQWHAHNLAERAKGAKDVTDAYQAGYAKAVTDKDAKELTDRAMWAKQSSDYEEELYALRHPAIPVTAPVVLCHQSRPSSSAVPKSTAITSGPVPADPTGLDEPHETDIGSDLIAFATDVQAMAIQCKAIQEGYLKLVGF